MWTWSRTQLDGLGQFLSDPIDCLIRQVFWFVATAARENLYESVANLLVLLTSLFAIRMKPVQQSVKKILTEHPLFIHVREG